MDEGDLEGQARTLKEKWEASVRKVEEDERRVESARASLKSSRDRERHARQAYHASMYELMVARGLAGDLAAPEGPGEDGGSD